MSFWRHEESRVGRRFTPSRPVMVEVLSRGKSGKAEHGELLDIGLGGARFILARPLVAGMRVYLDVHFPDPPEGVTTIRFKAIVTRSQEGPPHEISVRFQNGGRFLRGDLKEIRTTERAA